MELKMNAETSVRLILDVDEALILSKQLIDMVLNVSQHRINSDVMMYSIPTEIPNIEHETFTKFNIEVFNNLI